MSETSVFRMSNTSSKSDHLFGKAFHSPSSSGRRKSFGHSQQPRIKLPLPESGRDVSPLDFFIFTAGILLLVTGLAILLSFSILLAFHLEFFIILPFGTLGVTLAIFLVSSIIHFLLSVFLVLNANFFRTIISFACSVEITICLNIFLLMAIPIIARTAKDDPDFWKQRLAEENKKAQHSHVRNGFFQAWDKIQKKFSCCGVQSMDDWMLSGQDIPVSCCKRFEKENCTKWYTEGCSKVFSRLFYKYFHFATGFSILAIVNNILSLAPVIVASWFSKNPSKRAPSITSSIVSSPFPSNRLRVDSKKKLFKPAVSFRDLGTTESGELQPAGSSHSRPSLVGRGLPAVTRSTSHIELPKQFSLPCSDEDFVLQIIDSVIGPELDSDERARKRENS